jgi:hypothetical protein
MSGATTTELIAALGTEALARYTTGAKGGRRLQLSPEQRAREAIDGLLKAASEGVAVREFRTTTGTATRHVRRESSASVDLDAEKPDS